ncbi:MAG: RdgB/HAM1 family non-canonical purine NTP pyrophosphatase [Candidatus Krumholzibacteriota bacterium]|nr:RdgB/HAM1 family non-canonical purine NTP pyrophosphatase [Candidatus Krumholzibacteriota bacterium]
MRGRDGPAAGGAGPVRVVLATGNPHKVAEIRAIVRELDLPLEIVDPPAALPPVVEDGATLEANAVKKAAAVCRALGMPALADDTGLEIDALGGAPGLRAARWAGPEQDFAANVAKALGELAGVPAERRTARFRCVVALCMNPDAAPLLAEGRVEGRIAEAPAGAGGFGYDPIFYLPERELTLAEIPAGEKNRLSHRYRALAALGEKLRARG